MRRFPPPLSVTSPRPSRTTRRLVLTTLAVCAISIRTGRGPQRKRMTPPFATARTTARDVQLRGVPLPTQRSGCEVSTARASRGTFTAAAAAGAATARQRVTRAGSRRIGGGTYPWCTNGVVVASSTKPSRCRIGRLSGEASTWR